MTGFITIDGKETGVTANAATPIFYRQLYKEDFLLQTQKMEEVSAETFGRMAFVMITQYDAGGDMEEIEKRLTKKAYMQWLASLDDPMAIEYSAAAIADFYFKNQIATARPKE